VRSGDSGQKTNRLISATSKNAAGKARHREPGNQDRQLACIVVFSEGNLDRTSCANAVREIPKPVENTGPNGSVPGAAVAIASANVPGQPRSPRSRAPAETFAPPGDGSIVATTRIPRRTWQSTSFHLHRLLPKPSAKTRSPRPS